MSDTQLLAFIAFAAFIFAIVWMPRPRSSRHRRLADEIMQERFGTGGNDHEQ